MSLIDSIRYRLRAFTRPRQHETELAEDIEFFVSSEARQTEHAAHGRVSTDEARRAARKRFGNSTYYREEARRISGLNMLDVLAQDVRFALRTFVRTPVFTVVSVVTLAIGIGANTAIFSAVDTLLLRPLPFREPDRLMSLGLAVPASSRSPARDDVPWSYRKVQVFRAGQTAFSHLTAWNSTQSTVRVGDDTQRIWGEFIDAEYFPTLGIAPALGRAMLPDEGRIGGPAVAVISDELWRSTFSADPSVLGRTMAVDVGTFTVIGVAPPGFAGVSGSAKFWISPVSSPAAWDIDHFLDTYNHVFYLTGRLAPGVPPARAAAITRELGPRIDAQYPEPGPNARKWGAAAHSLDDTRVDDNVRRTLFMLLAAVGMVLLVACANVASLFLVRAAGRRREIAVRLAIGASRWRLVRQLLVESVLLALLGGIASLAVALVGVKIIASAQPVLWSSQSTSGVGTVIVDPIRLDFVAFAFTGAIAIATGVLFGLIPAIQSTRPSLTESLKIETGAAARSFVSRRTSLRNALTVMEIALAVVLLAGSGVLIRSLANLLAVRPGFQPSGVLTMRVNRAPAWSRDSINRFYDVAVERLRRVPGVTQAAIADCAPQSGGCSGVEFQLPDRGSGAPVTARAGLHWITADWHSLMRIPVLKGRSIASTDQKDTPFVVVVNETAARTFWPGEDPVGKRVTQGADTAYVVGVVGDVRFGSIRAQPTPDFYISYYQRPLSFRMMLHVRTMGDPAALTEPVRRALREVAPGFPTYDIATMEMRIGGALGESRFLAQLLSVFAGLALALATIGTYGVISYAVAQRTREMGVRVALGATKRDVMRLVVGQGIALATVGGVIGLGGAVVATRLIRARLYGVEPTDPVTLVGIVVALILAVLVASWIPARRAASVPAIHALRGG